MTEDEKRVIEQLTATVNTLISAVEALFVSHPDPASLAREFLGLDEKDTVRELGQASPDETFVIAQRLRQGLLLRLRASLTRKP